MDLDRIHTEIGDPTELERGVHGVVAAAGLNRILRADGQNGTKANYLEAVRQGRIRHLRIDLTGLEGEEKNLENVLEALGQHCHVQQLQRMKSIDDQSCEDLCVCTYAESMPESLCKLTTLVRLSLKQCIHLTDLPQLTHLTQLIDLTLAGCTELRSLPEFTELQQLQELQLPNCTSLLGLPDLPIGLKTLNLNGCTELQSLTPNLGQLLGLLRLLLDSCTSLSSLPDAVGQLAGLMDLSLRRCSSLTKLPSSLSNLHSLSSLKLEGCQRLGMLPDNFGALTNLTKLNLCNCTNLDSLPDLRMCTKLHSVDMGLSRDSEGIVYIHGLCPVLVRLWEGCGYAPGCRDGMGSGYGISAFLFSCAKLERCHVCAICRQTDIESITSDVEEANETHQETSELHLAIETSLGLEPRATKEDTKFVDSIVANEDCFIEQTRSVEIEQL